MKTILIIDDEESARENLRCLLSNDFRVITAGSGIEGLQKAKELPPDLILTDLQMPEMDGIEVCKMTRQNSILKNIPIMIVSGSHDVHRRTECFLWGADDFVTKPYSSSELVARLFSKLRWSRQAIEDSSVGNLLTCGNLSLDERRYEVLVNGHRVDLTNYEFKMLKYFLNLKDVVLSRDSILKNVWTGNSVTVRTVDTHICTLRNKLGDFDYEIHSVHGRGYILRKIL
ncbi:MAG: response regulator transcription factor [Pseudobdellovibrionaceae bacterium]